jgi:hypothetical protein
VNNQKILMLHNIKHMVVSYIDTDYTYSNYNFDFVIPESFESSDKLIDLIKMEINRQSWYKLIEHMKIVKRLNDCYMHELPQKNLEGVGQLSADTVLSKFLTCEEIEKEHSCIEEEKMQKSRIKISEQNSCCGTWFLL